jgi:hypothetical protein
MSAGDQEPPRKRPGITWPIAIAAVIGLAFGLYNLWKDLFAADPMDPESYLIFSFVLDGVIVIACGTAIFLLLKARSQGNSDHEAR